jgi:hypothetical protein
MSFRKTVQGEKVMEEEKQKISDIDVISTSQDGKWITDLENHISASEESSEKSYEQERQRLRDSQQALEQIFSQGKGKFLFPSRVAHVNAETPSAARSLLGNFFQRITKVKNFFTSNLPQDHSENNHVLERQVQQDPKEISELEEKRQGLIRDAQLLIENSLEIFGHHHAQLEAFLKKLREEPTINKIHLQQCQILFENANSSVEKLREERAKKTPNLALCNSYMIEASKFYQACYRNIIILIDQQPAIRSISGDIQLEGTFKAGGNMYVAHGMTINNTCEASENVLKEMMGEIEKKFEKINTQYDELQQNRQKKEQELASSRASLILQQEDLYKRLQAEKVTAEKHAAEQLGKIKAETEQTKKQMQAIQQGVVQLGAISNIKAEQIEETKKTVEAPDIPLSLSPAEQAQVEDLELQENQYDEHRALALALKGTQNAWPLALTAWKTVAALAGNLHFPEQQIAELLTAVIAALKDRNAEVKRTAQQVLTALIANPYLSEPQIAQIITTVEPQIAEILTTAIAGLKDKREYSWHDRCTAQETLAALANYPRLSEQQIAQILLATTTDGLKDEDWRTPVAAQQTLAALAGNNQHLSKPQIAQIFAATVAGLKNTHAEKAVQQTLVILPSNPRLSESQIAQVFVTADSLMKDKDYDARVVAWQILSALASNPRLSESQIVQVLAVATAGLKERRLRDEFERLKDEYDRMSEECRKLEDEWGRMSEECRKLEDEWQRVPRLAQETLAALAGNPCLSNPQIAQVLVAATAITSLKKRDDYSYLPATQQTLAVLARNPYLSEPQITQILVVVTDDLMNDHPNVQLAAQKTLSTLISNMRLSKSQTTQIFAAVTATVNLKNGCDVIRKSVQETLAILADSALISESQIIQISVIATNGLKDKDLNVRSAARKTLAILAASSYISESQIAQISATVIVSLKNEKSYTWEIRETDRQALTILGGNPRLSGEQITQMFIMVTADLEDQNSRKREVAQQILVTLAGSSNLSSQQVDLILAIAMASLKDQSYRREGSQAYAQTLLLALAGNLHLSKQQATQISSMILSGMKGIDQDYRIQESIRNNLIQQIKNCSLDQLRRYITLANTFMQQDGDIYVQLTAISMFITIRQRCQSVLASDLATSSQAEEKQQAPQITSAEAATIMGLLSKPKERAAPSNHPNNPLAAATVAQLGN